MYKYISFQLYTGTYIRSSLPTIYCANGNRTHVFLTKRERIATILLRYPAFILSHMSIGDRPNTSSPTIANITFMLSFENRMHVYLA